MEYDDDAIERLSNPAIPGTENGPALSGMILRERKPDRQTENIRAKVTGSAF